MLQKYAELCWPHWANSKAQLNAVNFSKNKNCRNGNTTIVKFQIRSVCSDWCTWLKNHRSFMGVRCFFILKWLLFMKEEEMLVRFNIQMSSTASQPRSSLSRCGMRDATRLTLRCETRRKLLRRQGRFP